MLRPSASFLPLCAAWLLAITLVCGFAVASDDSDRGSLDVTIEKGRELFQREWVYEPPEIPNRQDVSVRDFEKRLSALPGDGLGPMFNANSCESCHAGGGGAGVQHNVSLITLDPRMAFLIRRMNVNHRKTARDEIRDMIVDLHPGLLSPIGRLSMETVIHEKSTRPLYEIFRQRIRGLVPGGIPDEWFIAEKRTVDAIAENPVLAGRIGEIDFYLSQRNSPALYGLELIDKISDRHLTNIARSQSHRTSGKVTGRLGTGKFGWRGQTASLGDFVRGACANELGLQLARSPQAADPVDAKYVSLGKDMTDTEVSSLFRYVQALPKPEFEVASTADIPLARQGKQLFVKIGCANCHAENVLPAKGIYSDLLLHDMGELLQAPSPAPFSSRTHCKVMTLPAFPPAERPLGSRSQIQSSGGYFGGSTGFFTNSIPIPTASERPAEPNFPRVPLGDEEALALAAAPEQLTWEILQREWRTPPLWGVADSGPYLHDGRAATLDAAIRWHGGEALDSASEYRSLSKDDRRKVIVFLASLRAPLVENRLARVDHSVESVVVQSDLVSELLRMSESVSPFD
ncbi:MAG: di-heme oxidoredictase family protein [Rubripirellula sp.]